VRNPSSNLTYLYTKVLVDRLIDLINKIINLFVLINVNEVNTAFYEIQHYFLYKQVASI